MERISTMDYYVKEIQIGDGVKKTAGIKARDDLYSIMQSLNMNEIEIPSQENKRNSKSIIGKMKEHFSILSIWKNKFKRIKAGDRVFIQFPIIEHSLFFADLIKSFCKRNIEIVLIIHDLEILRSAKRSDLGKKKRLRIYLEEKRVLKNCSKIVAHNTKMKEYLIKCGIDASKIAVLEIFDYLIPEYDLEKKEVDVLDKNEPIIIAGALRKHKAYYAYQLPENQKFNLYGVGYTGNTNKDIKYYGAFPPEQLPYVMQGAWGLVWDGTSSNTCEGVFGEYLRINNPHKTSLYLASGIPIIIWKNAALAEFVKENNCGLMVESLYEIKNVVDKISQDEYATMKKNAEEVGEKLRSGFYTKKITKEC